MQKSFFILLEQFQCSLIHSTYQLMLSLGFWLRVLLLVMMLPFGITGLFADQIYLLGLHEREISYFKLARKIFPFDKEIITSEALSYTRNLILDKRVVEVLKEALIYDPYSAEMLAAYVQYANIYGNKNEALKYFGKLKKISPNSNMTKSLEKIMKGL